jgi:hypothetical protein
MEKSEITLHGHGIGYRAAGEATYQAHPDCGPRSRTDVPGRQRLERTFLRSWVGWRGRPR